MDYKDALEKVNQMVKDDNRYIVEKVKSILHSGQIELSDYDNDFRLPKIILSAVYSELSYQREPIYKNDIKTAKKLEV